MHTSVPFPALPKQLKLEHTSRRGGTKIVVHFKRGENSLCGHYEGDLAIDGRVGDYVFDRTPLNEVYTNLLLQFTGDAARAIDADDATKAAEAVLGLYDRYTKHAIAVHCIAARSVCTDASRITTALTFANNFVLTVLYMSRLLLEDGRTVEDTVVEIDPNLGGLSVIDGYGVSIPGLEFKPEISKIPRQDLSKGFSYLSSRAEVKPQAVSDTRLDLFLKLVSGESIPDVRTPNSVFTPIADAFRAKPTSISKLLTQSVVLLRENCLESEAEEVEL